MTIWSLNDALLVFLPAFTSLSYELRIKFGFAKEDFETVDCM